MVKPDKRKVGRAAYYVDADESKARKTLQREVADVLQALDELCMGCATMEAFSGVPLHATLEMLRSPEAKLLPETVRKVGLDWHADACNRGHQGVLAMDTREVGKRLLQDLRAGERTAQELVERIARRRMRGVS